MDIPRNTIIEKLFEEDKIHKNKNGEYEFEILGLKYVLRKLNDTGYGSESNPI